VDGQVGRDELTAYASQYRCFEAAVPALLAGVIDRLDSATATSAVERVLADETGRGGGAGHLELFDDFAAGLGADRAARPSAKTAALLDTYDRLSARGAASVLSGLLAYEIQSSEVARTKAAGLRAHYDLGERAIRFWDTHGTLDDDHSSWSATALAEIGAPPSDVVCSATAASEAWWAFLDEREASRA
jgi:pyrroloquinoline-quinone synthase